MVNINIYIKKHGATIKIVVVAASAAAVKNTKHLRSWFGCCENLEIRQSDILGLLDAATPESLHQKKTDVLFLQAKAMKDRRACFSRHNEFFYMKTGTYLKFVSPVFSAYKEYCKVSIFQPTFPSKNKNCFCCLLKLFCLTESHKLHWIGMPI